MEQLTITTLRNVIGGITLEATLTSRDHINGQLRVVLDEATGKWGIRVNRVELKSVDPPNTIQEAMAKQMRAERDCRAAILTAEGVKQSQILTAEGEQQSAVLQRTISAPPVTSSFNHAGVVGRVAEHPCADCEPGPTEQGDEGGRTGVGNQERGWPRSRTRAIYYEPWRIPHEPVHYKQ